MIFKEFFEPVVVQVAPREVCWVIYRRLRFLWWSRSEIVLSGVTDSEYRAWRKIYEVSGTIRLGE